MESRRYKKKQKCIEELKANLLNELGSIEHYIGVEKDEDPELYIRHLEIHAQLVILDKWIETYDL